MAPARLRTSVKHRRQPCPLVTSFDADALKNILPKYGLIDTTEGQRLGVESAARRIDMQVRNAQSYVPVPRSIPGVPRF
jgi:hypothetical protein